MNLSKSSRLAAITLGALLAAACSEQPATAPAGVRSLTANPLANVVQGKVRTLTVCAAGPIGTYGYSLSVSTTSTNIVNLPYGNSFTLSNDECEDVVTLSAGPNFVWGETDPSTSITVTQTSAPANTKLSYLIKTQEDQDQPACVPGDVPCGIDTQEAGPSTTVLINYYHGSVVSYWNEEVAHPVTGCTLTQGYWKNHTSAWPAGYDPNAAFFSSGKSWITILGTPPKNGNAYLILAHQYIAATLNVASGASMPADVKAAYDAATNYFQTGVGTDMITWASILDNYNNGLAAGGPAHCS